MSRSEMLERYVRMAGVAGTHVEFIAAGDLPARLKSILVEAAQYSLAAGSAGASNGEGESGSQSAKAEAAASCAALPASGWPPGVREWMEKVLADCGCEIVMPRKESNGYTWDRDRLAAAEIGITWCADFLADTGSLVVPAGQGMGTLASMLPPVHLVLSYPEGCRESLADYLSEKRGMLPSRVSLATGPSRTGDIEATLITGVHGPRIVLHLILEGEIRGQEAEVKTQEPEAESPEGEVKSPETDAESREAETVSRGEEIREQEPEAETQEPEAESPEGEVKGPETDAESREPEIKEQEPEAETPEPEAESPEGEVKSPETDAESREADAKGQKKARGQKEARGRETKAGKQEAEGKKQGKKGKKRGTKKRK